MKIAFAGTPEVSASVLNKLADQFEVSLVITRPDAAKGRDRASSPSPVADLATTLGIPVVKSNKIDDGVLTRLKESGAEVVIVVAFGSLVPKAALDQIKWWNLHFSLLPKWRGATPLQHSMIYGIGQGVSLFEIDAGLDTGNLIDSLPIALPKDQTAGEILTQLALVGADVIAKNLREPKQPTPQQGEPTLAPKITRTEAQITFEMPATEIEARVMALNPEPMAWCRLGDGELRLLRARAIGNFDWDAATDTKSEPGNLERRKGSVLVVCGSGSRLELIEVQPAGKKPMLAVDWARGFSGSKIG